VYEVPLRDQRIHQLKKVQKWRCGRNTGESNSMYPTIFRKCINVEIAVVL
jgi:hypothetical protein